MSPILNCYLKQNFEDIRTVEYHKLCSIIATMFYGKPSSSLSVVPSSPAIPPIEQYSSEEKHSLSTNAALLQNSIWVTPKAFSILAMLCLCQVSIILDYIKVSALNSKHFLTWLPILLPLSKSASFHAK